MIYSLDEKLNPGALSILRSELVGNQFLAVVSVALGLPNCINHTNTVLGTAMADWSEELVSKFDEFAWCVDPESDRDPDPEAFLYWNRLSSAPKTMGDVVESVIGAVFVDSGFSLSAVYSVLDTIIYRPWWDRFRGVTSPEGITIQHPVSELSKFLDSSKCTQLISRYEKFNFRSVQSEGLFTVTYLYHEEKIGSGIAETKREARKIAAFNALTHIRSMADSRCECQKEAKVLEALVDEVGDEATLEPN